MEQPRWIQVYNMRLWEYGLTNNYGEGEEEHVGMKQTSCDHLILTDNFKTSLRFKVLCPIRD
jgi:hypothetical protein